jgi:hypothetical protein
LGKWLLLIKLQVDKKWKLRLDPADQQKGRLQSVFLSDKTQEKRRNWQKAGNLVEGTKFECCPALPGFV